MECAVLTTRRWDSAGLCSACAQPAVLVSVVLFYRLNAAAKEQCIESSTPTLIGPSGYEHSNFQPLRWCLHLISDRMALLISAAFSKNRSPSAWEQAWQQELDAMCSRTNANAAHCRTGGENHKGDDLQVRFLISCPQGVRRCRGLHTQPQYSKYATA
jgi:hypothetical protein